MLDDEFMNCENGESALNSELNIDIVYRRSHSHTQNGMIDEMKIQCNRI